MADDSRRGDSNMADADVKPDGGNSVEITTETVKGDTVKEIPTAVGEVRHSATEATTENLKDGSVKYSIDQDSLTCSKDTEETKKQLARVREELNRAMEESARAKDEVEKAKKDLAEAKQDTSKSVEEKAGVDKTDGNSPEKFGEPSQSSGFAQAEPQAVLSCDNQAVVEGSLSASNNQNDCDKEPSQKITSEDAQMEPESSSDLVNTKDGIKSGKDKNGVKDHSDHELEEDLEDVVSGEEHDEEAEDEGEDEEGEDEEDDDEEDEGEEGDEAGEQAAAKPLDDDEDRRNPQYIPKRGGFYEHDDRTREEGEEGTPEQPVVEEKPKKNMRSEAVERWGHDMFDEIQQGPKSDHELVAVYGYDIRQEEGAPRARRRRRYGRGPNKYDRTWEDEEAYSRPRGRGTGRGGLSRGSDARRQRSQHQETPRKEDFPPLADQLKESRPSDENTFDRGQNRAEVDNSTGSVERRAGGSKASAISFRRGGGGRTFEERGKPRPPKARSETGDGQPSYEPDNTRELSLKESAKSFRGRGDITRGMVSRGTGARGGASRGTGTSPRGRGSASYRGGRQGSESANWKDGEEPQQTRSASHQHGSGRTFHGQQQNTQNTHADNHRSFEEPRGRGRGKFPRQGEPSEQGIAVGVEQMRIDGHSQPQPARHQDATRSKRYSSQRQRMTTPPPAAVSAPISQPPYPVTGGGNASYYAPYNDSPPPNYVQAAPGPMLPMAVAAQGAPPTYMGPPMYPTGGPSPFPATPYQGYPAAAGPPPVGVPIGSPTQDNMYGGGIMYYDPGRQPIRHGVQPPRRAKAAIPIVAPDGEIDSYMVAGRPSHHD